MTTTCAAQEDEINELTQENRKVKAKLTETLELNRDLMSSIMEHDTIEMDEPEMPKRSILVIGDSNVLKSKDCLDKKTSSGT